MGKELNGVDRVITHADRIITRFDMGMCDSCEDVCGVLTIWGEGGEGQQAWRHCVHRRDHLSLEHGLAAQGRFILAAAGRERDRAAARWLLEHQPSLW